MKAVVTSVTEVSWDGQQTVQFDVIGDDNQILISHSVSCDVDQLADEIKLFLREYKKKVVSKKKVKIGDSWEV